MGDEKPKRFRILRDNEVLFETDDPEEMRALDDAWWVGAAIALTLADYDHPPMLQAGSNICVCGFVHS